MRSHTHIHRIDMILRDYYLPVVVEQLNQPSIFDWVHMKGSRLLGEWWDGWRVNPVTAARARAAKWLVDALAGGPRLTRELAFLAEHEDHPRDVVDLVARSIGIERIGDMWALPVGHPSLRVA